MPRTPPPSPWQGVLVIGFAIAALGVIVAALTFDPADGSVSAWGWGPVIAGALLFAVAIDRLTP